MDYSRYRHDDACRCRPGAKRRPPRPDPYPDCGYIVEKIVESMREDVCYEGELRIACLPEHLCPPLTLRALEIVCIEPVCAQPGTLYPPAQSNRLAVTLLAWVSDSKGCRAQGQAKIEICVNRPGPIGLCGLNIRRGGDVYVVHACYCACGAFSVCLNLCVQTILSRCEMVGRRPSCPPPCPDLPLYPPPVCPPRRGDFCGYGY